MLDDDNNLIFKKIYSYDSYMCICERKTGMC